MSQSPSLRFNPASWTRPFHIDDVFGYRPTHFEVELGSGMGRFLVNHARKHPDTAFLGIERMLIRVRKTSRRAQRHNLTNVRLLYVEACYAVNYLIPDASVKTYYLFFPDPWPKNKHRWRRLFDTGFLTALNRTLIPSGRLYVATDHLDYFDIIAKILRHDDRFKEIEPFEPGEDEKSDFERLFLSQNKPIGRCGFQRHECPGAPPDRHGLSDAPAPLCRGETD